jgi:hypothetical protein
MMVPRNEAADFPEGEEFSGMFTTPGEGRAWKNISVMRFDQAVEEVVVPASSSHVVLVNAGPQERQRTRPPNARYCLPRRASGAALPGVHLRH